MLTRRDLLRFGLVGAGTALFPSGHRFATLPEGQWPYAVGPTLFDLSGYDALGGGMVVRHVNNLPANHRGFGAPMTTVHFHGGHHLSRADGFPTNIDGFPDFVTMPGGYFDHCYPVLDCGVLDKNEG